MENRAATSSLLWHLNADERKNNNEMMTVNKSNFNAKNKILIIRYILLVMFKFLGSVIYLLKNI